jgi:hypothetical protein
MCVYHDVITPLQCQHRISSVLKKVMRWFRNSKLLLRASHAALPASVRLMLSTQGPCLKPLPASSPSRSSYYKELAESADLVTKRRSLSSGNEVPGFNDTVP